MKFGIVGLGGMGAGLSLQALEAGHEVVGFNRSPEKGERLRPHGLAPVRSIAEMADQLPSPRVVLLYVPHGAVDDILAELLHAMDPGDIVIDGGNSDWRLSMQRAERSVQSGVSFLDAGTSGGVSGARHGACFMVGGDPGAFARVLALLRALASSDEAVFFAGPSGAGHLVKLVHNAIEFGMVQAIAEGVELLQRSGFELDLAGLFNNWAHGSVIRGWLIELMRDALMDGPPVSQIGTAVEDTGEVKWILEWAARNDIPSLAGHSWAPFSGGRGA